MHLYNMAAQIEISHQTKVTLSGNDPFLIICTPQELIPLRPHLPFDEETIADCLHYDEHFRFDSYDHYDFISWLYFWLDDTKLKTCEMNLYISLRFLVLVIPEASGSQFFEALAEDLLKKIDALPPGSDNMNKAYYSIFDLFLTDFSRTLEIVEDKLYGIETQLNHGVDKRHFGMITYMKDMAYRIKKQIRPLLYIGDQFIVNENAFIQKENIRYFKNLDIRINKLYDFAASLQEFANQTLYVYDSRITIQTNEVINKLTILTIFFGPMTIVTGIYGMNFDFMPELDWMYGYPLALGMMAIICLIIYIVLKRKKWL